MSKKKLLKYFAAIALLMVVLITALYAKEVAKQPEYMVSLDSEFLIGKGYGTGVYVTPQLIITNYHVVHDMNKTIKPTDDISPQKIVVHNSDGTTEVATILIDDWLYDIAILRVKGKGKPIKLAKCGTGHFVKLQGTQGGKNYDEKRGILSSKCGPGMNHSGWFVVSGVRARRGDSGGAVVRQGYLIGIIRAISFDDDPAATHCVDSIYLNEIMERANAKLKNLQRSP